MKFLKKTPQHGVSKLILLQLSVNFQREDSYMGEYTAKIFSSQTVKINIV